MENTKKSLKPATKSSLITYGMLAALFVIVEAYDLIFGLKSSFKGLLVPICIYITLAVSLNLVVGILGELSLGHAGFMCVGAYVGAFFTIATSDSIQADWIRMLLALVIGGVAAAIIGILIGIPVLRLKGDYLAIVTLAFGEIIKNIVNILYIGVDSNGVHFSMKDAMSLNLLEDGKIILKGATGISGTSKLSNFFVAFAIVLITVIISLNLINSRSGRAIMSIRDNRIAAEATGINVTKYKLLVFSLSAGLAGVAGVLFAHNISGFNATTNTFGYNASILILVYVVLGGIGSIRGSIISAIILYALPEVFRVFNDYRMLIYAVVIIVLMIVNNSEKANKFKEKISIKKFIENKKNSKFSDKEVQE